MDHSFSRRIAKKTKRREFIIDSIVGAITSDEIFNTLNIKEIDEERIKIFMHPHFLDGLVRLHKTLSPNLKEYTYEKKAHRSLAWESDVKTQIPNLDFLGGKHRPDFTVNIEELNIAVEIKRGDDGSFIRDGIGQSLVYSMHYDFVVYLLVDQSTGSSIVNSLNYSLEKSLIDSLWDNYNIRLVAR